MSSTGLRESKKAATRLALARAVLRLAIADGIEQVTIENVAADAGVSVRTFHNYFGGKEEALAYFVVQLVEQIVSTAESRPADESLWEALQSALREVAADYDDPDDLVALIRMLDSEPSLVGHTGYTDLMAELTERVMQMFADRGTEPSSLFPHLAFHASLAAARAALEFWSDHRDDLSLDDALATAFGQLTAGLAQPIPAAAQPTAQPTRLTSCIPQN